MKNLPQLPIRHIEELIHIIRGQKVILGPDLARLYRVETRVLMQSVRRNRLRFPDDFMFELSRDERRGISHSVTSLKFSKSVFAFTEHGVAMLSSVLRSHKAVEINIRIIRAFIRLRQLIQSNEELARRIDDLEKKYDDQFSVVFKALRQLMEPPVKKSGKIGY